MVGNPGTLLSQFFGLHMVKPRRKDKVYFVIMGNVFDNHVEVHERYDLKGSTVGRLVPDNRRLDPSMVMKDLDFDILKRKIHLGAERKAMLMAQIRKDAHFLQQHSIMDYSLLLGIHYHSLARGEAVSFDQTLSVVSPSTLNLLEAAFPPVSAKENQRQEWERRKSKRRAKRQVMKAAERQRKRLENRDAHHLGTDSSSESARGGTVPGTRSVVFRPSTTGEFTHSHPLAAELNALQGARAGSGHGHGHHGGGAPGHRRSGSRGAGEAVKGGGLLSVAEDGVTPRDEVYYLGIIDILQVYNARKRAEHLFKSFRYDSNAISAIAPDAYAKRFCEYMDKCIV